MGHSFANIHVDIAETSRDAEAVADQLAADLGHGDYYREVDDADDSDRTIAVAPSDGDGWVTSYDSRTRHQNLGGLEREASERSATLDRPVVGVLMHDGDVLELRLADDGDLVDRFSSDPYYFGSPEEIYGVEEGEQLRGDPSIWADTLAVEVDEAELRDLWHGDTRLDDADKLLESTIDVFGWSRERATVGYLDLQETGVDEVTELRHFELVDWQEYVERVEGPPSFQPAGSQVPEDCAVGEGRKLSVSVTNEGGAAEGLVAFAWGPALEREIVEVEQIELAGGASGGRETRQPHLQRDEDGTTMALAPYSKRSVGPAVADTDVDPDHPPEVERRISEARQTASLSLHVDVRAVSDGEATLHIGVMDPDVPESRGLATTEMSVLAEPRAPLRARESPDREYALRQMQTSSSLFAIAHFDAPAGAWAERAADVCTSWARYLAEPKHLYRTYLNDDTDLTPKEKEYPPEEIGDDLVERLTSAREYRAHGRRPRDVESIKERTEPGFGFAYYRSVPTSADPDDEAISGLGFWAHLEERGPDDIEALERRLRSHVDTLAGSQSFLQASTDRWNWTPSSGLERLPYELACDIRWIGDTLGPDWLRRWLRAATSTSWVGPELWSHLDEASVAEVAHLESLGAIRRLTLRDDTDLDALEAVLADVLPDADDRT